MSRRAAAHGEGACAPARPYMGPSAGSCRLAVWAAGPTNRRTILGATLSAGFKAAVEPLTARYEEATKNVLA